MFIDQIQIFDHCYFQALLLMAYFQAFLLSALSGSFAGGVIETRVVETVVLLSSDTVALA